MSGSDAVFEAIAVVEHQGSMTTDGEGQGHYICDVLEKRSKCWFRTNDNSYPVMTNKEQVTQNAYVVLLKRSD